MATLVSRNMEPIKRDKLYFKIKSCDRQKNILFFIWCYFVNAQIYFPIFFYFFEGCEWVSAVDIFAVLDVLRLHISSCNLDKLFNVYIA
jgi:hypothetical protein